MSQLRRQFSPSPSISPNYPEEMCTYCGPNGLLYAAYGLRMLCITSLALPTPSMPQWLQNRRNVRKRQASCHGEGATSCVRRVRGLRDVGDVGR